MCWCCLVGVVSPARVHERRHTLPDREFAILIPRRRNERGRKYSLHAGRGGSGVLIAGRQHYALADTVATTLVIFYLRYFSEDRYCEVVRCLKGLWILHARRRQQRRLRASFGGAGLWIQEPGRRSTSDLRRQTRPQRFECRLSRCRLSARHSHSLSSPAM